MYSTVVAYLARESHRRIALASQRRLVLGRDARQPAAVKHTVKPGRVTVAGKPGDDLAPGTLNSILKQAALKG